MRRRSSRILIRASLFAGALVLAQAATAGRVILNNDEWTLTDYGFGQSPASTTTYAQNLASYMNIDGGACNLLVYSNNFGLTGAQLNAALTGAGCTVTHSTGAFDLATLSGYDGVFLGANPYNYNVATLAAYVSGGHSVYIAGGTGYNDGMEWDSFTHQFGLDFAPNNNNIGGLIPIASTHPLFAGVTELYFNNGNSVSAFGNDPETQILVSLGNEGLFGVYADQPSVISTDDPNAVPEPTTLALLGIGVTALGLRRRKAR